MLLIVYIALAFPVLASAIYAKKKGKSSAYGYLAGVAAILIFGGVLAFSLIRGGDTGELLVSLLILVPLIFWVWRLIQGK